MVELITKKIKGAIMESTLGCRCALLGYGTAVSGYGLTEDGKKFYALSGCEEVGVPGDDVKSEPPEEPDILLLFRDNAAIQRIIDELIKLRDK